MATESEPGPIYSTLAQDPDMIDLVENFVKDLPQRLGRILEAEETSDGESFRFEVHQLKGTCGVYGFEPLYECLVKIESLYDSGNQDSITGKLAVLTEMCTRVTPNPPP